MGVLMIIVTGAGGYLGRAVVQAALARGHRVRAVLRRPGPVPEGAEAVVADLAGGVHLGPVLEGADAIIHCAARMQGTESQMLRDTVGGTAALISAAARRTRLVLVSSLSVYAAPSPGGVLDEATPLEPQEALRDAYTRCKLRQEEVARGAKLPLWIIRPGIIWGPGRLWNAHLGVRSGPLFLRVGGRGELPLVHVDHLAQALVTAAETPPPERVSVVNLLDRDRPTRAAYLAALNDAPRLTLPLSWRLPDLLAGLLAPIAPRLPGLLRRPVLRARLMPLTYASRADAALGPLPQRPFAALMAQAQQ